MGVSKVRDVAVDRHFAVPAGVIDVRQLNREVEDFYYDDSTVAVPGEVVVVPTPVVPAPPSSFSVHEQRVRITSDGRSVVDVVLDFPDVPGVHHIDVRVSKVS